MQKVFDRYAASLKKYLIVGNMGKNLTNVLVVEDDATILSMIGAYLAKDGFFPLLCDN